MEEVAPGVYVETGYASGNVGFIATGAGLVCVDVPMLPEDVHRWRAQIESVTDEPIVMLVQTDYDQERIISTYLLDVPIIAHDAAWERMRVYSSDKVLNQISEMLKGSDQTGKWQARMPDITFSERLILYKGSRDIHVLHGGGHSPATCMVYLPEENLIFTGDVVFCSMHPSMTEAETKQWLSTLNQLRKMSVGLMIPGHGVCCDKEATHALSEYVRDMRAMVRRSYQSSRSKSETSSAVIPEFMNAFLYDGRERERIRKLVKGGSDRIYDEYRAAAKADAARARGPSRPTKARRQRSHS